MWIRFTRAEIAGIAHYLGVLVIGVAAAMLVPLVTAVVLGEWEPALDYVVGVSVAGVTGLTLMLADVSQPPISQRQSLIISALAWVVAAVLGAVPLSLSPNYLSYLDALFDAMSGFTVSGLTLAVDLDHMSYAHNMWRHMTQLIGGQGIIVAAISLAIAIKGGAFSLYLAEGRDERILPNVLHTARFIWFVSAIWIATGTAVLTLINLLAGMSVLRGSLHALWLTVAAFDTGGFAPMSMNVLYYHSPWVEATLLVLMMAGSVNFNLHADIWRGDKGEVLQNVEVRAFVTNMAICVGFVAASFGIASVFSTDAELWRKGVFHVLSAGSAGHQTLYPGQWQFFGGPGLVAVVLAMAFGGMMSSTGGGIKSLRVAVILMSLVLTVKRALSPSSAVVTMRFHHLTDRFLTPEVTASAFSYFTLYMLSYISGGLIGAAYGHDTGAAIFESVSAVANSGLTSGVASPFMPSGMKVLYILQMWSGRLEFLSAIALVVAIVLAAVPEGRRASTR